MPHDDQTRSIEETLEQHFAAIFEQTNDLDSARRSVINTLLTPPESSGDILG
jgi:hypothetical protein